MNKQLWTGAVTFQCPEDRSKQFGMVAAQGPLTSDGRVTVLVNKGMVTLEETDEGIRLLLPESWAIEFAKNIELIALRLSHLRSLNKLGLLNDTAYVSEHLEGIGEHEGTPGEKS